MRMKNFPIRKMNGRYPLDTIQYWTQSMVSIGYCRFGTFLIDTLSKRFRTNLLSQESWPLIVPVILTLNHYLCLSPWAYQVACQMALSRWQTPQLMCIVQLMCVVWPTGLMKRPWQFITGSRSYAATERSSFKTIFRWFHPDDFFQKNFLQTVRSDPV